MKVSIEGIDALPPHRDRARRLEPRGAELTEPLARPLEAKAVWRRHELLARLEPPLSREQERPRSGGPLLPQQARADSTLFGEAKMTGGHNLKARYVIHAVGPVWGSGTPGTRRRRLNEPVLLANCYRRSLGLAAQHRLKSIAFPAISTGAYGYPIDEATQIAVREARKFEKKYSEIRIVFCCFSPRVAQVYRDALDERPRDVGGSRPSPVTAAARSYASCYTKPGLFRRSRRNGMRLECGSSSGVGEGIRPDSGRSSLAEPLL